MGSRMIKSSELMTLEGLRNFRAEAQSGDESNAAAHRPGELLVQFAPGTGAAARAAALSHVGGGVAEIVRGESGADGALVLVKYGAGLSVEQAMQILSHRPGVVFAEPNFVYQVDAVSNDPSYTGGQLWGMYGDQTSPANQYGSQAGEAWAAGHTGSMDVVV